MALEGTLDSFSIAEIYQLIATQAKTGVLEIDTGDGVARVRFVYGQLLDAYPAMVDTSDSIGNVLIRAGYIKKSQLDFALEQQRRTLRRLGDILIRMGAIRTSEFQKMLALQRREMAYSLLRLRKGSYIFRTGSVEYEEGVDTLMSVDAVLMEGSRQIDEWPALLKRIPSEKRVYRRVPDTAPSSDLSREEISIYELLDGVRTVRDVADRGRLGDFVTWDCLARLYDDRLIEPVEKVKVKRAKKKRNPLRLPASVGDATVAVALLCVAAALLLWGWRQMDPPDLDPAAAWSQARSQVETIAQRSHDFSAREPLAPAYDVDK